MYIISSDLREKASIEFKNGATTMHAHGVKDIGFEIRAEIYNMIEATEKASYHIFLQKL